MNGSCATHENYLHLLPKIYTALGANLSFHGSYTKEALYTSKYKMVSVLNMFNA